MFKMQSTVLLCFAALVACSYAHYRLPELDESRWLKDLHFERTAGAGKVFGGLGASDAGLFGRGGYRGDIFNDQRGHLEGQAYGERTLGANGDSSVLGSKFKWNNANDNVRAAVDVHKELGKSSGFKMQSTVLLCFAALVACSHAHYRLPELDESRWLKDLHFERNAGAGKVFGGLGASDAGLFGRGGYKADFFNDRRGHLEGQAYGQRTLGADGDSSVLGSKFKWNNANDNVRAAVDLHKELGKSSGVTLTGDGVWKVDKNTRLVAGGIVEKTFGHDKPQLGLEAKVEHDF